METFVKCGHPKLSWNVLINTQTATRFGERPRERCNYCHYADVTRNRNRQPMSFEKYTMMHYSGIDHRAHRTTV